MGYIPDLQHSPFLAARRPPCQGDDHCTRPSRKEYTELIRRPFTSREDMRFVIVRQEVVNVWQKRREIGHSL